jgi:hypothetical protein
MAIYKVIQDIEAEDKLLGPFGLRQFIYLIIVAVSLFVAYKLTEIAWYLALPLLPHTIFFAVLALPVGGEQPTETWLLAKVRFYIKPRVRVWDQTGATNLVTVTAPKKIEKILTKDMSQTEVKSRLQALANTIDSRGWAVKNVNVNLFSQPTFAMAGSGSDRLIDAPAIAQPDPANITASDDMLDEQNNPTAQNLDRMISASSKAHRDRIISNMKHPDPTKIPIVNDSSMHPFRNITYNEDDDASGASIPEPAGNLPPTSEPPSGQASGSDPDYWFLNDTPAPPKVGEATFQSSVITPDPSAVNKPEPVPAWPQPTGPLTEEELLEKIHEEKKNQPHNYGNLRVIKPIEEQKAEAEAAARAAVNRAEELGDARADSKSKDGDLGAFTPTYSSSDDSASSDLSTDDSSVTQTVDPDIIELANNDDLNVETIARQAKKSKEKDLPEDGEVVINLH